MQVRMRDYLSLVVSDSTGQPYDRVVRELSRNKWMDPKQAIEYGMIDKVRIWAARMLLQGRLACLKVFLWSDLLAPQHRGPESIASVAEEGVMGHSRDWRRRLACGRT